MLPANAIFLAFAEKNTIHEECGEISLTMINSKYKMNE
jgi:hypothetical protein